MAYSTARRAFDFSRKDDDDKARSLFKDVEETSFHARCLESRLEDLIYRGEDTLRDLEAGTRKTLHLYRKCCQAFEDLKHCCTVECKCCKCDLVLGESACRQGPRDSVELSSFGYTGRGFENAEMREEFYRSGREEIERIRGTLKVNADERRLDLPREVRESGEVDVRRGEGRQFQEIGRSQGTPQKEEHHHQEGWAIL